MRRGSAGRDGDAGTRGDGRARQGVELDDPGDRVPPVDARGRPRRRSTRGSAPGWTTTVRVTGRVGAGARGRATDQPRTAPSSGHADSDEDEQHARPARAGSARTAITRSSLAAGLAVGPAAALPARAGGTSSRTGRGPAPNAGARAPVAHRAAACRAVDRGCGHGGLLGRDRTDVRSNACTSSNTGLRHESSDTSNTCLKLLYEPRTVGTKSRVVRRPAASRAGLRGSCDSPARRQHSTATRRQAGRHRSGRGRPPTGGSAHGQTRRRRPARQASQRAPPSRAEPAKPARPPAATRAKAAKRAATAKADREPRSSAVARATR